MRRQLEISWITFNVTYSGLLCIEILLNGSIQRGQETHTQLKRRLIEFLVVQFVGDVWLTFWFFNPFKVTRTLGIIHQMDVSRKEGGSTPL